MNKKTLVHWPIIAGLVTVAALFSIYKAAPDFLIRLASEKRIAPSRPVSIYAAPPLVADWNVWNNKHGYYEVVGEVRNKSQKTFEFVEVEVEFLNDRGQVVGRDTTYACSNDYILPSGRKSFKLMGAQQSDYKTLRVSIKDYTEVAR